MQYTSLIRVPGIGYTMLAVVSLNPGSNFFDFIAISSIDMRSGAPCNSHDYLPKQTLYTTTGADIVEQYITGDVN